ncbi:MAG: hypothetical protein ACFFB2_17485 [Promethearchaeota archaeon]
MKAERIKLTSPEAFMAALSRYESNKDYNKNKINDENEKWGQGTVVT